MFDETPDWRELQALHTKLYGEAAQYLAGYRLCPRCKRYSLTVNKYYNICSHDCLPCTVAELQKMVDAMPAPGKVVRPEPPPKPVVFFDDLTAGQKESLLDLLEEIFDEDFGASPIPPIPTLRQLERRFEGKRLTSFGWWPCAAVKLRLPYDTASWGGGLICPFRLQSRDARKALHELHRDLFPSCAKSWEQFNRDYADTDMARTRWWDEIQAIPGLFLVEDVPASAAERKLS